MQRSSIVPRQVARGLARRGCIAFRPCLADVVREDNPNTLIYACNEIKS